MSNEKLTAKNWNLLKLQRYQQHDDESLVRLGTPTWESVKYRGTLYDYQSPLDEFLKLYAAQFDAVEYHASFFDAPSERRMKKLKSEIEGVNQNFKFCPLVPRRISHEFELGDNLYDLKEFLTAVRTLGNNLGPCILRLPETFTPSLVKKLLKFLTLWDSEIRLTIHFTNGDWFRRGDVLKTLVREIQGSHFSVMIEDRFGSDLITEKLLTSDHLIVRFYGKPAQNQDDQRLSMWVYKLSEYKAYGVKNPYFFLYEEEEMCLSILRKVSNAIGGRTRVPATFDMNSNQISFLF